MMFFKGSTFILGIGMCLIAIIHAFIDGKWGYAVPLCLFGSLLWIGAIFINKDNSKDA